MLSKPETRELYDRYGHEGLRSGGFNPSAFDLGSLSDLFSAFFGDDLFGVGGRRRRARGADAVAQVEIDLVEAANGTKREVPFPVSVPARRAAARAPSRVPSPRHARPARVPAGVEHVSRTVFGEFIRSQPCPQCGGAGRVIAHPCGECGGSGRIVEERTLEVDVPPGIHDGQQIRLRARATRGRWAAARATSTYRSGSAPTRASCARATTSSRRST